MKVFPDSKVYIISGCPCDPDYEHTLYWANKEGQHAYFMTKAKYRLDAMSYQRAKRGRIRVQYKVEDLYDCNYLAFQNTSFGNKWFYAFIDDVTYVNNITSEISYTIDVIQTWITEMDLQQCFVIREHSTTDVTGDNLIPEDVDTGEMVSNLTWQSVIPSSLSGDMKIICAQMATAEGSPLDGAFWGNTYAQGSYLKYDATVEGYSQLRDFLRSVNILNVPNAITSIFMCPEGLLIENTSTPSAAVNNLQLPTMTTLSRSDGTPVRNNKLNTHPFTYLNVTNLMGQTENYAYEFFTGWGGEEHVPRFNLSKSYNRTLSLTITPTGYKTISLGANFDKSLTYNGFPECAWCSDQFANRILMAGLSAGVGALSGAMVGGAAGAIMGGLTGGIQGLMTGNIGGTAGNAVAQSLAPIGEREDLGGRRIEGGAGGEAYSRYSNGLYETTLALAKTPLKPLDTQVHAGSPNDMFNSGYWGFYYSQMQPTQQYIDRIDDYFSRYGYATNLIKVPNISSRPHWNYVKTTGCKIGGSIPCTDEKLICSIFDKGVTFWKHPEEVGNFSLDNSPT